MKKTFIILLLAVAGYGLARAQTPSVIVSDKAGWHKIAERTIDFQKDRDEILVMGSDKFASIKFKVLDAPIDLIKLEVFYTSGDNQNININLPIKAPGESRVIDLNGGERSLKKIVFDYKTLPNRNDKKAKIEVWGLKTNADKMKK